MSIFSKIKDAIFGHKAAAQPAPAAAAPPAAATAPAPAPAAPPPVDVGLVLSQIAQETGRTNLNYNTSIVDLMKLLDLDASLQNREALATELGYTGPKDGSAEMNIWLHKAVVKGLQDNGGVIPANMAD